MTVDSDTAKGGAVEYNTNTNWNIVLYSSSFDKCSAPNGDRGAVFVCGKKGETGETPTHGLTSSFNSSYCCYSGCSACNNIDNKEAGYGQIMFIFCKKHWWFL